MIVTMGEFEIDPDNVPDILPQLSELMVKTRSEDGCIMFSLLTDPLRPGVIIVSELWENTEKLSVHLNAPHVLDFHKRVENIGFRRFDVSALDVTNRRNAADLVNTLKV